MLLTGQLEVQREHFEERLAELEKRHKRQLWEQVRTARSSNIPLTVTVTTIMWLVANVP